MSLPQVELVAAYWTLSGDVYPFAPTEVSPFDFRDRVEAAAETGWTGMGLIISDVYATADKIGFAEMRRILAGNGMKHLELEFLVDWYHAGERRRVSDNNRRLALEAANRLGARVIKVGPGIGEDSADIPLMTEELGVLAKEAEQCGTQLMLEIMPFSNVRTVSTARRIVEGVNRANTGLLLDIWHFHRGNIDFKEISFIDQRFIKGIELNDANRYPIAPLWSDTVHKRRLPGDGVVDVPAFIRAVQAAGFKGPWGVEILSDVERKLPLDAMARRAFESSMRQFDYHHSVALELAPD